MAFVIKFDANADDELKALRVFDRRRVGEEIGKQLLDHPTTATRNRKCLHDFSPGFAHNPPLWELRVGDIRVFYDVDEENQVAYIRAIRQKTHGQTTEDIT